MNIKRIIVGFILIAFVISQFMLNKRNISSYESVKDFENREAVSHEMSIILKSNCYDCHSNHTNYRWYGSIGIVNIFQSHHIEEGKEHLNFSNWDNYSEARRKRKLEEIKEEVDEDHMPILTYRLVHKGLNASEKEKIIMWADSRL